MANYNQAPILQFDIPKEKGNNYYELPQRLTDIIFAELGNASAQLRVMIVLIGTKPGFGISEKWILERTGLQSDSYSRARTALIKKGWLTLDPGKSLTVNFKNILQSKNSSSMITGENKNSTSMAIEQSQNRPSMIIEQSKNRPSMKTGLKNRPSMVLENCPSMVIGDSSSMVLGIINKQIINKQIATGTIDDPYIITTSDINQSGLSIQDFISCPNGLLHYNGKYFKPIKEEFEF